MTSPSDGRPPRRDPSALPPHLDPRGGSRRVAPRVTGAYREGARGPAPRQTPLTSRPDLPRRRAGRVLSWIALVTSVMILGTAGVGYVLVRHYNANITQIDVFGHGRDAPAAAPKNAKNVLLVGSDTRAGENAIGTGGKGFSPGQRSDTIILAHLYGKSDKALFVSFPRDSWVEIPAWTDPKTGESHRAHHGRINSAFASGGPALLVLTIEKLTGIRVDHYVQVDFVGFKKMVDRLGGVDICLKQDVDDEKAHLKLSRGRHHVDGTTALAFARARKSFAGQDLDRIKHQQQLIGSMVNRVLSAGTLANPLRLNGFLEAATSSLTVDKDLSFGTMKDLALRVRGFSSGAVLFTTAPIEDPAARINGASVVRLDEQAGEELFAALRRDEAPTPEAKPTTSPLTVAPGSIRVRVFNGSGVTGLGRRAYDELGRIGFQVVETPTNRGQGASKTVVLHGPTKADSARTLAAAIPGAVLQEDPNLQRTLEVVVGSEYDGAKPVKVTGTPGPSPSKAPTLRSAKDDICA